MVVMCTYMCFVRVNLIAHTHVSAVLPAYVLCSWYDSSHLFIPLVCR